MKKVISFSLWGDNEGYCFGAVENAKRAPDIYPGWICRFYCDEDVPQKHIDELLKLNCEIVKKNKSEDFLGLYWRFEPMFDDNQIERFIVRDTDSRINKREAQAVKEWEESHFLFHVIRDNPAHNVYVLGGTWGAVAGILPQWKYLQEKWLAELKPDLKNPRGIYHNSDQLFLNQVIWPYVETTSMAHDNYFHYTGRERPLTVKLKRDGYIGMVWTTDDNDRTEVE